MVADKNKLDNFGVSDDGADLPGENERGPIDSDESRDRLEQEVKSELKSLKEELAQTIDLDKHQDNLLQAIDAPEKNNNNDTSEKTDTSYKQTFEERSYDVVYPFARAYSPKLIQACEQSRMGTNLKLDIAGIFLGTVDSLVQVGQLSVDALKDLLRCLVSLRAELTRTRQYLREIESNTNL